MKITLSLFLLFTYQMSFAGAGDLAISGNITSQGLTSAATEDELTCFDSLTGQLGKCNSDTLKGDTGATGPQGPKGDTGLQGIQGFKGDTGAQGIQGERGFSGGYVVYANGVKLGSLLSNDISNGYLTVFNDKGYTYKIEVGSPDALIANNNIYYDGSDCSGTPHVRQQPGLSGLKHVFNFNSSLYYVASDATAVSSFNSISFLDADLQCNNVSNTVFAYPISVNDSAVTGVSSTSIAMPVTIAANFGEGTPVEVESFTVSDDRYNYMSIGDVFSASNGLLVIITGYSGSTDSRGYSYTSYTFRPTPNALPEPAYGEKGSYYFSVEGGIVYANFL